MDTTPVKLIDAGHRKGNYVCSECDKLRKLEVKWILRLGIFYGDSRLNGNGQTENTQIRIFAYF